MATSQKLPSGNWRAQFFIVDKDGTRKRKSVTAPTRWEAEKMAAEYAQNAERVRNLFTVAALKCFSYAFPEYSR